MSGQGENYVPVDDWWDYYSDAKTDEKSQALSQTSEGKEEDKELLEGTEEEQDNAGGDEYDKQYSGISLSLSELSVDPADSVTRIPSYKKSQRIKFLSWNIDGLNKNDLSARTLGICKNIAQEEPHIVFLQEVIKPCQEILKKELPMYYHFSVYILPYFVAILLRKDVSKITKAFAYGTPRNNGKHALIVKCTLNGKKKILVTAYLDGTQNGAGNRRKQLRKGYSWMEKCDSDQTVIFGGDLNLCNQEVAHSWDLLEVVTEEKSQAMQSPKSDEEDKKVEEENQDVAGRATNDKEFSAVSISLSELSVGLADSVTGMPTDEKPHRIRLLSWNIDGLDKEDLRPRTLGVCKSIVRDEPHVVFLQEVIMSSLEILKTELLMYYVIPAPVHGYFVTILLRKDVSRIKRVFIFPLPTSMGRHILSVECTIKGENFCFMTAHLESMRDYAAKRRQQLKKAFSLMEKCEPDQTVIFGGDLNLRDQELIQIGGQPANIEDIWEVTGRRKDAEFTWDLRYNDNSGSSGQHGPKPMFRFDRIYIRHSKPRVIEPVYFELIGFNRLPFCHRFCSDHWGLLTHFDILSKLPKTRYR